MSFSRHHIMRLALTAMHTLLLHRTAGAGEIHRWTDSESRVYFGDRPPVTVGSEIVRLHINTCSSPGIESLAMDFGAGDRVVMYSARWCGVCQRAKRHFEAERIPFTGYDVETSAKGRRDYRKPGARGVPVMLVGKQRLNGFTPASFERIYRRWSAATSGRDAASYFYMLISSWCWSWGRFLPIVRLFIQEAPGR